MLLKKVGSELIVIGSYFVWFELSCCILYVVSVSVL